MFVSSFAVAQTETKYTYDALGRLVKVEEEKPNAETKTREIAYDSAGNRTQYTASGGSGSSGSDDDDGASVPVQPVYAVLPINGMTVVRVR